MKKTQMFKGQLGPCGVSVGSRSKRSPCSPSTALGRACCELKLDYKVKLFSLLDWFSFLHRTLET